MHTPHRCGYKGLFPPIRPEPGGYVCPATLRAAPRHWTALSEDNGLYEHLDANGVKLESELKWIRKKRSRQLNPDEPNLLRSVKEEEESTFTTT